MADTAPSVPGFFDGLGDRVVVTDRSARALEVLRLRPELVSDPRFEPAVRERAAQLAAFQHAGCAHVRHVGRLPGGDGRLALVSDFVTGWRLSEVLQAAEQLDLALHTNAVLFLLRQLVSVVSDLHALGPDVAHGALGPERIVVTATGRLVVTEHVFGSALPFVPTITPQRAWRELRLALPPGEHASFGQASDVLQVGLCALALVLSRPLRLDDYPQRLRELLDGATESLVTGERRPLKAPLRDWLERVLGLSEGAAPATVHDAHEGLDQLVSREGYLATPTGLVGLLQSVEAYFSGELTAPVAVPGVADGSEQGPARESGPGSPAPSSGIEAPAAVAASAPGDGVERAAEGHPAREDVVGHQAREGAALDDVPHEESAHGDDRPGDEWPRGAAAAPHDRVEIVAEVAYGADIARGTANAGSAATNVVLADPLQVVAPAASVALPDPEAHRATGAVLWEKPQGEGLDLAPGPRPAWPAQAELAADDAESFAPEPGIAFTPDDPAEEESRVTWPRRAPAAGQETTRIGDRSGDGIEVPAPPPVPRSSGAFPIPEVETPVEPIAASVDEGQDERRGRRDSRPGAARHAGSLFGTAQADDGEAAGEPAPRRFSLRWTVAAGVGCLALAGILGGWALMGTSAEEARKRPAARESAGRAAGTAARESAGRASGTAAPRVSEAPAPRAVDAAGKATSGVAEPARPPQPVEVPPVPTGELRVLLPFPVYVFEGGEQVGVSGGPIELAAGRHRLELVNEDLGFRSAHVVDVRAAGRVRLQPEVPNGTANVNAIPWAEVWIDGQPAGETPLGNLSLPIGTHQVVFKHPQLGEQARTLVVTAVAPARLSVEMKQ